MPATATAAQRTLIWPPVRTELVALIGRWAALPDSAYREQRADWSRRVWALLQELVAAVDAENEAPAAGQPWRSLRPRVDEAGRALAATLLDGARPAPFPA